MRRRSPAGDAMVEDLEDKGLYTIKETWRDGEGRVQRVETRAG